MYLFQLVHHWFLFVVNTVTLIHGHLWDSCCCCETWPSFNFLYFCFIASQIVFLFSGHLVQSSVLSSCDGFTDSVLPFNLPLSTNSAHRISHLVAPEQTCLNRFSLFLTLKNQLFYWHGRRRDMTRVNKQTVCLWASEQSSQRLINVCDPLCKSSVCFVWVPVFF